MGTFASSLHCGFIDPHCFAYRNAAESFIPSSVCPARPSDQKGRDSGLSHFLKLPSRGLVHSRFVMMDQVPGCSSRWPTSQSRHFFSEDPLFCSVFSGHHSDIERFRCRTMKIPTKISLWLPPDLINQKPSFPKAFWQICVLHYLFFTNTGLFKVFLAFHH